MQERLKKEEYEAPEEKDDYQRYQKLGGVINEEDYESTLLRAKSAAAPSAASIKQVEFIAKTADIALHNEASAVDERVALYGILRNDPAPTNPEKPLMYKDHYTRMSDQRLFAEVLRMVGDADSLQKLISAHPNIPF